MSTNKRKRARKACNPCHQRKRKCDGEYPCGMCSTYQYQCRYNDDITGTADPPVAKRAVLEGRNMHIQPPVENEGSPPTGKSPGIFEKHKSRYTGASAAMAFPHILGLALGSDNPPKINSIAYNFGIRPEEASNTYGLLGSLISEDNLAFYSDVYFSAMGGSIGDVIDPRIYAQRCHEYYHGPGSPPVAFGAIAAGIAAVGSFLSSVRYSRESELLQYAKAILDDPASTRMLSVDYIIAWGMRLFYLRATTRPSSAWVASCTLMHHCEVVGLHKEENIQRMASVASAASAASATALGYTADRLRRIFWILWAAHQILSYECDRSAVIFTTVTTQAIIATPGSVADQFVQIIQIIPSPNSPFQLDSRPLSPREELCERLTALSKLHFTHPFLVATKADLAFCFYRRIYQFKAGITDETIQVVIDIGRDGLDAAEQLASQGRLLWNVIGSVFQYACILLAIDTPASSAHIPAAFKRLENIARATDTVLTRQALSIARHLLSLNIAKKRKELLRLEAVEAGYEAFQTPPEPESNTAVPDLVGWGVDWDQFLVEPYLSMFPDIEM
ncbi:hypothetical protein N7536_005582 [Penicillium majusculum]|uniref:Zn(2)-C6 fungal-type domain-containing protein n=1 Tax=Penicillium solitum TaxID=60172 RepID=A0A1V6RQW5_9EURO|nr:uncharacterized protein PENSOL_c001G04730 [Penicillium solitum]KAJ5695170.1 hypothetical protein N7536_005582 [Penicillium majusculum]OQE03940.1 hypothetical protein PENSOL_c001G04730 [Penicillium solitum]